jgi:AcrR family transcriptional regulator
MSTPEKRPGARERARPGAAKGAPGREGLGGVGREKVSEIQRARMLAAMAEVAAERGAANVTVAHVVARSGVSRRTFYEIFEDREDCFLAAFDDAIERLSARVLPAYAGEDKWRERIRAGLAALLEFLDEEPGAGRLCIVETLAAGPIALERRALILAAVREAIDEGRRGVNRARPAPQPPPLTAEGVVGAVLSVIHARLTERQDAGRSATERSANQRAGSGRSTGQKQRAGRFGEPFTEPFTALLNPLMATIVLPYLGSAAATKELERPKPRAPKRARRAARDPLKDLDMRLTYRTVRVLMAISQTPGASNRRLADASGVHDQGQISKLLGRLQTLGLIQNTGIGAARGEPNAWQLTPKGREVGEAIQVQTAG